MENNTSNSVSIIIPAYNEEATVSKVVGVAKELPYVNEVIVVDDGSYDKTVEEAKFAGADVISHASNQGKGSAIKTGFRHSKGDIIAFIDADIYNLTQEKIDMIIRPILEGRTDITKTKFVRESGRVTELTAKPLLKFFFPEINFKQPLSGQFAGKRSVLNKIKFEKDYGVDVGIVLDADVRGIKIEEVDIGEIKHDMSPLENLNEMANEVTRTIVDRAMEYGRVTMIDSMGNYIRMATLGLSLIILGLFTVFFVQGFPYELGVIIGIIGLILAIYYLIKLFIQGIRVFRKRKKGNFFRSFIKMHFPVLISAIVLILMISTFFSAANYSDGKISIEPTSRNFVIFPGATDQPIYVRGPYTVDSALENQTNIIRMPGDALNTLELSYGDKMQIGNEQYTVVKDRPGEENVLRLPFNARAFLDLQEGDVISDGKIKGVFEGIQVEHTLKLNSSSNSSNKTITENTIINSRNMNGTTLDVYLDHKHVGSISASFKPNETYDIYIDGSRALSININNETKIKKGNTYLAYSGDHIVELNVSNNISTSKRFFPSRLGPFISFNLY
ncbi:glycosyltransferase [Methanobrevibacter sp. TMH8]|uniref:glycosyltransferase n=1 Tax=Methanobrevibacter sp. TMH8 TaxID=2848611 RepID=UPI001CCA0FFE|nr:glycosyltransferase [Methanobrevibacter sp. TMH8]MBZ9570458.1 glycosyltransferase [Methanobrevibacter sp. TMH8]